jgi:hypothetical protein
VAGAATGVSVLGAVVSLCEVLSELLDEGLSLRLADLLSFLKSVTYQPVPLRMNEVWLISLRIGPCPHWAQLCGAASLSF